VKIVTKTIAFCVTRGLKIYLLYILTRVSNKLYAIAQGYTRKRVVDPTVQDGQKTLTAVESSWKTVTEKWSFSGTIWLQNKHKTIISLCIKNSVCDATGFSEAGVWVK